VDAILKSSFLWTSSLPLPPPLLPPRCPLPIIPLLRRPANPAISPNNPATSDAPAVAVSRLAGNVKAGKNENLVVRARMHPSPRMVVLKRRRVVRRRNIIEDRKSILVI
jgi:hypothetical protein